MGLKIYSSHLNLCDTPSLSIKVAVEGVPTEDICGMVFCGTSNTLEYHQLLDNIKSATVEVLGRRVPVTLIPQYLLPNGGFSLHIYTLDSPATIRFEEQEGVCCGVINSDADEMLFVEGIPSSNFAASVKVQGEEVFAKLANLLSTYGFEVDDIVRQWNYIGNIVACREGKQNYQEFNDARSHYYAKGSWKNGYPAATGIGSNDGIVVGGIAFKAKGATKGIFPIDNPLQVAAHVYSKQVLIDDGENAVKSTPKFERAKLIETKDGPYCFVSGTAAIRGEASVDANSAKMQTIRTIENIEHLVSKENLVRFGCNPYDLQYTFLHVFVKNAGDYDEVRAVVEERCPNVKALYSVADVCRSELLVEIEGILTL
ncbi:MAG: hypothetical protein IKL20_00935 [Alistipes sp.]|nr:hypothetical protein [Alistipes sp.]